MKEKKPIKKYKDLNDTITPNGEELEKARQETYLTVKVFQDCKEQG